MIRITQAMTNMSQRNWRKLACFLAFAIVTLVLLLSIFETLVVGFPKNPATAAEIEEAITRELPPGSTRTQVEHWLGGRGFGKSWVDEEHKISAILRDTDRSILVRGDIQADFFFDKADRLVDRSVCWWGTGP